MKKIIENLLCCVCTVSILLACAERNDGSCSIWWALSFIFLALICGGIWSRYFNDKPLHIPIEVYDDLDRQIEGLARQDGGLSKIAEVSSKFGTYEVIVKVSLHSKLAKGKFKDESWRGIRTTTETNWYCFVEVIESRVQNLSGKEIVSDFDEGLVETEYEDTSVQ